MAVRLWTPDEVRLAISLYVQIPFGRIDYRNPEIIELSQRIGRTPSSVALKLANFAALDETLPRSGMQNVSKLDREIWSEFFQALLRESPSNEERAQEALTLHEPLSEYLHDGVSLDRFAISKQRLRQDLFRTMVLSAYDYRCAVTGIEQPELLVAGHIKPWALDISQRLNPSNGICLNRLHDRAFDKGLITFEDDGELMFSPQIRPGTREKMLLWEVHHVSGRHVAFCPIVNCCASTESASLSQAFESGVNTYRRVASNTGNILLVHYAQAD